MYKQKTLKGTLNTIFSPESAAGALHSGSQAGRTTSQFGQAARPASRTVRQASSERKKTADISGRKCTDSYRPASRVQSFWSRLQVQLGTAGSTECALTWKAQDTPAGRPYYRLAASVRRTNAKDSGLQRALWITASARDWKDTPGMATVRPNGRSRVDQLPRQVAAAMWPTPTAADGRRGSGTYRAHDTGIPLPQQAALTLGRPQNGSFLHTTTRRGALNPEFVCWLMGYPEMHIFCLRTAMQLYRKSQRK